MRPSVWPNHRPHRRVIILTATRWITANPRTVAEAVRFCRRVPGIVKPVVYVERGNAFVKARVQP